MDELDRDARSDGAAPLRDGEEGARAAAQALPAAASASADRRDEAGGAATVSCEPLLDLVEVVGEPRVARTASSALMAPPPAVCSATMPPPSRR